jgi:hypothetical protein
MMAYPGPISIIATCYGFEIGLEESKGPSLKASSPEWHYWEAVEPLRGGA